jgi:hypothetical protein
VESIERLAVPVPSGGSAAGNTNNLVTPGHDDLQGGAPWDDPAWAEVFGEDHTRTRHVVFHTAPAAEEGSTTQQAAITSRLVRDQTTSPEAPLDILSTPSTQSDDQVVLCLLVSTSVNPHRTIGAVMNVARNTGAGTIRVEGFNQSLQVISHLQQLPEHLRDAFEDLVMEVVLIDPESADREFEELQLQKVLLGILYLREPNDQRTLHELVEEEHPAEGFRLEGYTDEWVSGHA